MRLPPRFLLALSSCLACFACLACHKATLTTPAPTQSSQSPSSSSPSANPNTNAIAIAPPWNVRSIKQWPRGGTMVRGDGGGRVWVLHAGVCGISWLTLADPVTPEDENQELALITPPLSGCSFVTVASPPTEAVFVAQGKFVFTDHDGNIKRTEPTSAASVYLSPSQKRIQVLRWPSMPSSGSISSESPSADAVIFTRSKAVSRWNVSAPEKAQWAVHVKCEVLSTYWSNTSSSSIVLVDTECERFHHEIHAFNAANGKVLWTRNVIAGSVTFASDDVSLAWSHDSLASELDIATGNDQWTWSSTQTVASMLRVDSSNHWLISSLDSGTELIQVDPAAHPKPIHIRGHARVVGFAPNEQQGITISTMGGATGDAQTKTAADGSFSLEISNPGKHVVRVDAPPSTDPRVAKLQSAKLLLDPSKNAAATRRRPFLSITGWSETIGASTELDISLTSTIQYNDPF